MNSWLNRTRTWMLAALTVALLSAAGCSTIASMAVKQVASKAGMDVAKKAYHKMKGDEQESGSQDSPVMMREIQVTSNPPGARIELNRKYIGDAPMRVRVQVDSLGGVTRDYTIRAVPTTKGQHPQTYRLQHYSGEPGDRPVPSITFDMTAPAKK